MASRSFGCELEFCSKWERTKDALRRAVERVYGSRKLMVKEEWYRSLDNVNWHMKEDSSTVGEIVTPVSTEGDLKRICQVVGMLRDAGVRAGRKDGFHVHVGARDVDPRILVASWARIERQVLSSFPRNRRSNYFCSPIRRVRFATMMEAAGKHRSAISMRMCKFTKAPPRMKKRHGTIEFRVAEGTFDPVLVRNWARFCLRFVEVAKETDPYEFMTDRSPKPNLRQVLREVGMESSYGFFDSRRRRFARV